MTIQQDLREIAANAAKIANAATRLAKQFGATPINDERNPEWFIVQANGAEGLSEAGKEHIFALFAEGYGTQRAANEMKISRSAAVYWRNVWRTTRRSS